MTNVQDWHNNANRTMRLHTYPHAGEQPYASHATGSCLCQITRMPRDASHGVRPAIGLMTLFGKALPQEVGNSWFKMWVRQRDRS